MGVPVLGRLRLVVAGVHRLAVGLAGGATGGVLLDVVDLAAAGGGVAARGTAGDVGGDDLGPHRGIHEVAGGGALHAPAISRVDEQAGERRARRKGEPADVGGGDEQRERPQQLPDPQAAGPGADVLVGAGRPGTVLPTVLGLPFGRPSGRVLPVIGPSSRVLP